MREYSGSFIAYGEDGQAVNLQLYTDFVDAGTFDDPNRLIAGFKEIRTDDGLLVNRLAKGKYQIGGSTEVLTSDDENAP